MSVRAIDRRTVHQICSGQVVLSLAVAVKELVENSLDAGATNIEVRLKEHGSELVEVADNGSGVAPENFESLTLKHHTSKLREFSDLTTVATFGFRGEALSSLCALSNLVVTTCHTSQPAGTRIEYDSNGQIKTKNSCAREVGTTVALHNLFHTLPVRHKEFQRNLKKEYARMVQMLQGYCLISTGVRITCHDQTGKGQKQLVVSTGGNSSVKENIINVFGPKQFQQLAEISQPAAEDIQHEEEEETIAPETVLLFRLSGYVSRCNHGYGRSATDRQFFFFNSRPCDHHKLTKTVNEVYHMYNRHQYPFVMLNISTAREHVDVNLTPDKRQVMLHQEKALLLLVKATLTKMYEPMQSQYDTQQESSPLLSQEVLSPNVGFTPSKLASLKRNFTFTGAPESSESQPKPKQPKLFDYGVIPRSSSPSMVTSVTPVTSVTSVTPVTPVTSPLKPSSNDSIQNGTVTIATASSPAPVLSPIKPNGSVVRTETKSFTSIEGRKELTQESQQQSMAGPDSELQSPSFDERGFADDNEDGERLLDGSLVKVELFTPASSDGRSHSQGDLDLESPLSRWRDKRAGCHGNTADATIHIDSADQYRGRVESSRNVVFDFTAVTSRLEVLQHRSGGDGLKGGEGRGFRAQIRPDSNAAAEQELRREISKEMFAKMEVIGQFNLGFIIVKLNSDLFIVDQHASDEKYNFERLQRETVLQHQKLLQPLPLELTAVGETVVMENLEIFRMNGFQFQIDMEAPPMQRVKLTAQPVSKSWALGPSDINELIFLLSDSPGEVVRPSAVRKMFASRACRSSVMIGTALNKAEMVKLLTHMGEINQPWNCPHGRPIMRHLIDLSRL